MQLKSASLLVGVGTQHTYSSAISFILAVIQQFQSGIIKSSWVSSLRFLSWSIKNNERDKTS